MSDIVRNAIIKLAIQLQTPNLKTSSLDAAVKAQEGLAQATKQAAAANQAAASSAQATATAENKAKAAAVSLAEAKHKQSASLEKAGGAAVNMARGLAYIAAGESDALAKAIPFLFVMEGTLTVAKNAEKLHKALAVAYKVEATASVAAAVATQGLTGAIKAMYVMLGPVGWLVIALAAAWKSVSTAYHAVKGDTEAMRDAQEKLRAELEAANQTLDESRQRYDLIIDAEFEHIELLTSQKEKSLALMRAMDGLNASADPKHRLRAGRDLLKLTDEYRQAIDKQKHDAIELTRLRERELKTAQEALKTEQEKALSTRASLGALDAGEKRRLERLTSKVERGETLTQKEAIDFQKLGGEAGRKIGDKFLATLDGGLGQRLEKLIGDPIAKAQAEFERRQKSYDAAVAAVNDVNDTLIQSLDAVKETIVAKLGELIDAVRDQQLEQSRQQSAARAAKAAAPK